MPKKDLSIQVRVSSVSLAKLARAYQRKNIGEATRTMSALVGHAIDALSEIVERSEGINEEVTTINDAMIVLGQLGFIRRGSYQEKQLYSESIVEGNVSAWDAAHKEWATEDHKNYDKMFEASRKKKEFEDKWIRNRKEKEVEETTDDARE